MTTEEREAKETHEEKDRISELTIDAYYERGINKRRRKTKKVIEGEGEEKSVATSCTNV